MVKKKEEEQITPEKMDLDAIMEEGLEKFDEDLKVASEDTSEPPDTDTSEGPAKEKETEDPNKKKPDKKITSEEKTDQEAKESPPDDKKDKEPPPGKEKEKKEHRFDSHDKAEEGYRDLQGEKTRTEQENKRLKQEIDTLKTAEKHKEDKVVADQKIMDFAVERHKESLQAIDALDPDDKNYQDDVAMIWAKKDRDIRNFELENSVVPEAPGASKETSETNTDRTALEHVREVAKKNDIDPDDELFVLHCAQAPTEDEHGKHIDLEDQITYAIEKTKNYLKLHEKRYQEHLKAEAEKKTKENQKEEIPLGRSTSEIITEKNKEEDKPVSLDDALESVAEERRL